MYMPIRTPDLQATYACSRNYDICVISLPAVDRHDRKTPEVYGDAFYFRLLAFNFECVICLQDIIYEDRFKKY